MATHTPGQLHLEQEQITADTTEILRELSKWLRDKAKFEKEGDNLEKCVDEGLEEACKPLINLLKTNNKERRDSITEKARRLLFLSE
ncbi:hypothetical protein ASPCAL15047 [Aspergillus calidoustus]|uniref:Uncharacterized protein n=1 Tax=Aspergillus calidoustus TaxID=454130 RepID=A0A0U5GHM3_ASPCI|nr:hypothetical protein ASPCAL15047 [Aspergillus calidoustus]